MLQEIFLFILTTTTIASTSEVLPSFKFGRIRAFIESSLKSKNDINLVSTYASPASPHSFGTVGSNACEIAKSRIPTSFAVLVNFGVDGRERMLFSSRSNENCGDNFIYDPFIERCRQVYCSAHFTLVNLKCVENSTKNSNDPTNVLPPKLPLFDLSSKTVNISLKLSFSGSHAEHLLTKTYNEIVIELRSSLAQLISINETRFANVQLNIPCVRTIIISFLLFEGNEFEPSNDQIITILTSSSGSGSEITLNLFGCIQGAISSIHTTLSPLTSFCRASDEKLLTYFNDEFSLIEDYNGTTLFVNKTGLRYKEGEFVANLLYVGKISYETADVSGAAFVCEKQRLANESCVRTLFDFSEIIWLKMRTQIEIKYISYSIVTTKFELEDGGISVCVDQFMSDIDLTEDLVSTILMSISLALLFCVLITYLLFKSLRSTVAGFNIIHLVISLMLMQFLFLTSSSIMNCKIAAISFHFCLLITLTWSSVIAFDIFRVFGMKKTHFQKDSTTANFSLRAKYMAVAIGVPGIIVSISLLADIVDLSFAPHYGSYNAACWMLNPWSTFIFFGIPLIISILVNITFYLIIVLRIRKKLREAHETVDSNEIKSKNQLIVFLRIGIMLGFTWILALLMPLMGQNPIVIKILKYFFIIGNTTQGPMLFIAYLLNRRIFIHWKNLITKLITKLNLNMN